MTQTDAILHPDNIPLLEFKNITVMNGNSKILDSISITLKEGENIAILGPNGAGKSSFIKTINREYYPLLRDEGVLFRVRGRDTWDVFELRSTFGIVSNDLAYAFSREMTAREVVMSGFFSSIGLFRHHVTPGMERKTGEILRFLEIQHLADRKMTEMSSGEARRVLIGRALVHNPKTLILDEPTNSLDLHALHNFRATCRKIARAGTGIILVTHNLHDIIPEITRVILMKEGHFCMDGPKEEVLTDINISNLFLVPVQVRKDDGYYYASGY
ncbi:MAG: ATP-binding cassette domain-containing protein [Methanomicrobiales archaeon]